MKNRLFTDYGVYAGELYALSDLLSTYFPNRSLLLRVLIAVQRGGYTETHTKREAVSAVSRPGAAGAVLKFIEDSQ